MENFIVSARKYRPQTFNDVVGQKSITNTLENAIKNNHLAQALLFTGPRGVGKTTCARILAKRINESNNNTKEEDFAFNIFELDAASNNSVDDIRALTDQVRIPPQTGNYKVYIIDEVHMLSASAFNAFLKTLEEPPEHAIFILATTEKHKIIPTILSRCQIFDFKRISVLDAKNYLVKIAEKEGIKAEDDALHIIAQKADGAMRDALSIFDRVVSFSGTNLTRQAVAENLNVLDYQAYFKTTDLLLKNDIPNVLIHFNSILAKGFEAHHFINGLASHFRDLLVAKDKVTIELLEVGDNTKKQYLTQAEKCDLRFLIKAIDLANQCDLNYKASKNKRLLVELTLMQLASITFDGAKKKGNNFIIPASFFEKIKSDLITDSTIDTPKVKEKTIEKSIPTVPTSPPPVLQETPKKPILKTAKRRPSALSLKSLEIKKEVEDLEVKDVEEVDGLPDDSFSEKKGLLYWNKYIERLQKLGENSVASIMSAKIPKIEKNIFITEVPNTLMQDQLFKIKPILTKYLRENLNNFKVEVKVRVNEEETKRYAYTPQEKFMKLREKNPVMDALRKNLDLDL